MIIRTILLLNLGGIYSVAESRKLAFTVPVSEIYEIFLWSPEPFVHCQIQKLNKVHIVLLFENLANKEERNCLRNQTQNNRAQLT